MPVLTSEEKMDEVRRQAFQRGLRIRVDDRLLNTPYRAMNPEIGKILDQPYIPGALTYSVHSEIHNDLAMDLNHENIEDWKAKELRLKGTPKEKIYPIAHKLANRKQRDFNFMKDKV
jgi:hypothetical protein